MNVVCLYVCVFYACVVWYMWCVCCMHLSVCVYVCVCPGVSVGLAPLQLFNFHFLRQCLTNFSVILL